MSLLQGVIVLKGVVTFSEALDLPIIDLFDLLQAYKELNAPAKKPTGNYFDD